MRILIGIPVLNCGGTEMQSLQLARTLIRDGHGVELCCYYEYHPGMLNAFEQIGVRAVLLKLQIGSGLMLLLRILARVLKELQPDVFHVQYMAPGFIPVLAGKFCRVRTIFATVHQPKWPYGLKEKMLLRSAARLCSVFTCNSRAVEESWFGSSKVLDPDNRDFRRKHFTIYNGVDVERIHELARQGFHEGSRKGRAGERISSGQQARKVIGVVGRLRWEKGQAVLIDAVQEVVREGIDAVLLVVGDGPDRQDLHQRAQNRGLSDHIVWLGHRAPEEVFQLYGVMDAVAVPSLFEGFGLTAAEAMAAGKPVVASDVGGLTELVENGATGILVPPGDSHALALAIIDLLTDHSKRYAMGRAAYERVTENFSMDHYSQSILSVYHNFLSY